MSEAEYRVYWQGFVWPKWMEHGESRLPHVEGRALTLAACASAEEQLCAVRETGWLPPLAPSAVARSPTAATLLLQGLPWEAAADEIRQVTAPRPMLLRRRRAP